MKKSKFGLF